MTRRSTLFAAILALVAAGAARPASPAPADAFRSLPPGDLIMTGNVASVRASVDARAGRGPNATSNADLMAAYNESEALGAGRFALKIPEATIKAELAKDPSNTVLQNFALIHSVFGSLDVAGGLG